MGEWKEYQLDELASVTGGKRLPLGAFLTDMPTSHPYIRTRDLAGNKVDANALQFVPDDVFPHIKQYIVTAGDIIVSVVGTIGLCAMIPEELHNASLTENCNRISGFKTSLVSPEYLFFYLTGSVGQDGLRQRTVGSTQPKLPMYNLREMPILLPPVEEQRSIASVLSSLDAKIDLLHRQNKTLEAMAETLFRQWFVEEAEEGWEEMRLDQFSTVGIGRTPPRKEQHWFSTDSTDVKWISIKDMAAEGPFIFSTAEYLTDEAVERFRVPVIPKDTVVLSFKMTLGRLKITTEEMLSNEAIAHFRINPDSHVTKEFLYLGLKTYQYETLGSTSTIVDSINSGMIREMVLQIPPEPLMDRFMEQCGPWFEKIKSNQVQIKTLTALRDTLLPKLMSGEVRVEVEYAHMQ